MIEDELSIEEKLEMWRFNVGLECSGASLNAVESFVLGGAVFRLSELHEILEWASLNTRPAPVEDEVERVARAMCDAAWAAVGEDWSLAGDEQRDEFRLMARAAIAALTVGPCAGSRTSPQE